MTQSQSDLFGPQPARQVKTPKAKPLPKLAPVQANSSPLTPAQQGQATKNRKALQAARDAARVTGLPRFADSPCPECGGLRIEAYELNVWVTACVNKDCVKCEANRPEYRKAMEVMRGER